MAASYGPETGLARVVVLLLGEKQGGKSSAANSILGRDAFPKKTRRSSKENATVSGIPVTVVDTPGWLSRSSTPDRVSQELSRGLALCHPQPHAILLVLPTTSSFGPEEWRAMEAQLRLLHTPIWQRTMVLFTHGDKLGGLPIQYHIRRQGGTLCWLLERCGNRHHVMSNQPGSSEAQVAQLFEKIQEMEETYRRPREIQYRTGSPWYWQYRMSTQITPDGRIKEERRQQQGRPDRIEMTAVHVVSDWRSRQQQQGASGWTHMPTGLPAAGPFGLKKPALGLILLGRRRSGKSTAGNMILNRGEFPMATKTLTCSVGQARVWGRTVAVVDTPGWSLFGLAHPKQVRTEIGRSVSLCPARSPVCFLLVIPVDAFREKDRRAVETHLSIVGNGVWRRTVVLFTYAEELRGRAVETHVREKGEPLQWVLDRCGQRHCVFDTNTGDQTQVNQLLEMVDKLHN